MKRKIIIALLVFWVSSVIIVAQKDIEQKTEELFQKVETESGPGKIQAYLKLLNYLAITQPILVEEVYGKAISTARAYKNKSAEANIFLAQGYAYTRLHEPLLAGEYNEKAYNLAEQIADSSTLCKALIRLGAAKISKGGINTAIEDFIRVENIATAIDDKFRLADAINYLAITYYLLDDMNEAIRFSQKGLAISEEIGYYEGKALSYEHLAIVKIKQQVFDEALELNTKAFEIRSALDDLSSISGIYYNYSVIHSRLKNFDLAIDYTKKSIEIRKKLGNIKGVGSNYLVLGNIFIRANQPDSALVYLNQAYDIKNGSGDTRAITSIVKSLSDVYEKKGDFKNAYKFLSAYNTYSDSLFSEESRKLSSKILAQQELVRKENEIKYLQEINSFQEKTQDFLIVIIVLSVLLSSAIVVLYILNRKNNKKLSEKNTELIALNRDREKFFSIISHDLRSPFHPIIGYSDLVINDIEKISRDEIKDLASYINISAKKIFDLLDNMLQWLAMNTGKMLYTPINFVISDELNNALKLFSNNIRNKFLNVDNKIDDDVKVFADKAMVGVIIRNIISNAIKFSKEEGKINISSSVIDKFIEISIIDFGVGIHSDQLKNLFTDKSKSARGTENESGTGLGLLLCKEMTERNGGVFTLESEYKKGTTVKFTLPLSKKDFHIIENKTQLENQQIIN